MQLIVDYIMSFLKGKLLETEKEKLVIGMSGGIDSSVVATLAVKAVGADHVVGVTMPCHSDEKDRWWAMFLAGRLVITRMIDFPLDNISRRFTEELANSIDSINPDWIGDQIFNANNKARLRMIALYSIARVYNGLVVGAGNKSEHMLGYFTKYGDGGTDIEPIADLFKTEVYELADFLEIPEEIINRPPSAGLWEGQTDENELGYTYKEIDPILKGVISGYLPGQFEEQILIDLDNRIMLNAHKMSIPPVRVFMRDERGELKC